MLRDIEILTRDYYWTPTASLKKKEKKNGRRVDTPRNGNHEPPTEVFFSFSPGPNGNGGKTQEVWAMATVVAVDGEDFILRRPGQRKTFRRNRKKVSSEDPRLS